MEALPENQCFAVLNAPRTVGERSFQLHGGKYDVFWPSEPELMAYFRCVVECGAFFNIFYTDSILPLRETPRPRVPIDGSEFVS